MQSIKVDQLQWASNEVLWEHIRAKCDRSWLQQLLVESLTGLRSHMLEMRVCGLVTRY